MTELSGTFHGGPADGRPYHVQPCDRIVVAELLKFPTGGLWIGPDNSATFSEHTYDARTGQYLGVQKWPRYGWWTVARVPPFPTLHVFPRWDALLERFATRRRTIRHRLAQRITPTEDTRNA